MTFHVGANDVSNSVGRNVEMVEKYRALISKLKESRCRGVVTGIAPQLDAPRVGVRGEWESRALQLNQRIEQMCKDQGIIFVDIWDTFYEQVGLFKKDGLHFNEKGVKVLSNVYEKVLQSFRGTS